MKVTAKRATDYYGGPIEGAFEILSNQNLAPTNVVAASTGAFAENTLVEIVSDDAFYINMQGTATSADHLIPANTLYRVTVPAGSSISVLAFTGASTVSIATLG